LVRLVSCANVHFNLAFDTFTNLEGPIILHAMSRFIGNKKQVRRNNHILLVNMGHLVRLVSCANVHFNLAFDTFTNLEVELSPRRFSVSVAWFSAA